MIKTFFFTLVSSFLVPLLFSSVPCAAQNNSIDIFKPLTGKNWEGHFVNSEDSIYTHHIKWEYMPGFKAVKETKSVPDLGFEMETFYYFDWEKNHISYLSLVNKDMISTGYVIIENSNIILEGQTFFEGGSSEFKKSFELNDNGILVDKFYRKKEGSWVRGHLIEYE
ncbi:MAG: hypothetical protein KAR09_07290 [Bacteroidales bacterium]|nr:hypothetical protein [Bacteroidales bacterium]